jgi:hypothetical protein
MREMLPQRAADAEPARGNADQADRADFRGSEDWQNLGSREESGSRKAKIRESLNLDSPHLCSIRIAKIR